jgi:putative pyoverdin transport system ATP-binding/permease protein
MHILRLLRLEAPLGLRGALILTCLAAVSNALLIGLINAGAELAAVGGPISPQVAILYAIAFAIYFVSNRASLHETNRFVQGKLAFMRLRIADRIRHAEPRTLEEIGEGRVHAVLSQEANMVAQNFPLLVNAGQALFLLAFCLLYIATLSLISFAVVAGVTCVGLAIYALRRRALSRAMTGLIEQETAMLRQLAQFSEGFQEIRLHADRNDALYRRFGEVADRLEEVIVGIGGKWAVLIMFSNAFLYLLVGIVVFVLPFFFEGYTDTIYKIAAAAIFCVGPVTAVTYAAPLVDKANVAIGHIFALEERLARDAAAPAASGEEPFGGFRSIGLAGAAFSYRDRDGAPLFTAGPIDLEIRRGEVVFLVGGNGGGKSTILKLLCGLYRPDAGAILVDGQPIPPERIGDYRALFAAIFPDFHLFDRFYGLEDKPESEIRALIETMGLAGKVDVADGRFTTRDLSTGQRKRLAMIVALLEDKDILIFDEWAADQDAHHREFFYRTLLPELKARGKTIVAITHDDAYWDACDRRLRIDLGAVTPEEA